MNILILTGRFGMGHIKAAEAIEEQILAENPNAEVTTIDFIDYMFPAISKSIYKGFNFMVSRCAGIYNAVNKAAGKNSGVPLKLTFTRKIDKLIEMYQADAIVVAFPVCSQYISSYKRMRRCRIPLYTYITDITAHEEWIAPETDKYFVGDVTTKNALLSKGISADKIAVLCVSAFIRNMLKRILPAKKFSSWVEDWDSFLHPRISCKSFQPGEMLR